MLKRALVFTNPVSLRLKNMQLVFSYKETPDESQTIPIEDIGIVLIENQQVSITIPLMNALADNNVQVVICDAKGMPNSIILNLDSNVTQGETIRNQISTGEVIKKQLWKQIVEAKILNQSKLLDKLGADGSVLKPYYKNVKSGDSDNREGIAARIYFSHLFGPGFVRDRDLPGINALLNYGYAVLRAAVTRALVSSGLFPVIGIYHHHRSNAFPLTDDMMEPYRPYVDEVVYDLVMNGVLQLTKETKATLIKVLYADTQFASVLRPLSVGLSFSAASLVKCFAKEQNKISFPIMQ